MLHFYTRQSQIGCHKIDKGSYKIFKKFKITLAPKNNFTLGKLFNKPKDKTENNKSGIYKIKCKDCEGCYIGQTSRNLETRYKEHMRRVKNKDLNKSAVAAHFWSHKYKFEEEPKLLKHISNRPLSELLIWEKIFYLQKQGSGD